MTGQTLIDSLTEPSPTTQPTPPDESPGETAVREGLSFRAGLMRLLGMAAGESIERNLEAEDAAFAKFANGKKKPSEPASDDMNIRSAGNVTINYADKPSGSQPVPVALKRKAGTGWLPKLMLATSLLGGGAGLGYIINDLLKPAAEAVVGIDTDTITEMDFPE